MEKGDHLGEGAGAVRADDLFVLGLNMPPAEHLMTAVSVYNAGMVSCPDSSAVLDSVQEILSGITVDEPDSHSSEKERRKPKFEGVFQGVTGYEDLDKRIAKALSKKATPLRVLEHPELPLHNNDCELAARGRVRKQSSRHSAASLLKWRL